MSARYLCPNDQEVMNLESLPGVAPVNGAMDEQYRCPFCHYSKDKATVIQTHILAADNYIPPSKKRH